MSSIATADVYLASDGARYDRAALAAWLQLNPTSPVDRRSMLKDLVALGVRPGPSSVPRIETAVAPHSGPVRGPIGAAPLLLAGFLTLVVAGIFGAGHLQGARYVAMAGASLVGCSVVLRCAPAVMSRGRRAVTSA